MRSLRPLPLRGVELLSQSRFVQDVHSYDLLKVKDRDGKEQEIWFNVDTSMNAMRDALGEGKKS